MGEGRCDGQAVSRILTSGGMVGSTRATEVYLGWEQCQGARSVTVRWPSGVVTTDQVEEGARVMTAEEPRWWSLDDEAPGTITLDPAAAGTSQACVGSPQGAWVCCVADDAPCLLEAPEVVGGSQQAKLDSAVTVALPTGPPRWTLVTQPSPPRPGLPVEVYARYLGDPREFERSLRSSAPT